ncbi:aminoglycoside 6-adenylyltransferase [Lysinibacillus sp. NPDC059133]
MIQEPDTNDQSYDVEFDQSYAYLMLFTDGNRMDFRLPRIEIFI